MARPGRPPGRKNLTPEERAARDAEKAAAKAARKKKDETAPAPEGGAQPDQPAKKADKPAAKKPGIGHNSQAALSDTALRSTYIIKMDRLVAKLAEAAKASSEARNVRKELKELGFETDEINFGLSIRKRKPEEITDQWRRRQRIAVFEQHPVGTQPDIFEHTRATTEIEEAGMKGETAGLNGEGSNTCPYAIDAPEGQAWMERWHRGQAERAARLREADERDEAALRSSSFDDVLADMKPDQETAPAPTEPAIDAAPEPEPVQDAGGDESVAEDPEPGEEADSAAGAEDAAVHAGNGAQPVVARDPEMPEFLVRH